MNEAFTGETSSNGYRHPDIIVLGASAGGVEALQAIVRDLPSDLPASVFIVLHTAAGGPNLLPQILRRVGTLGVEDVQDGMAFARGSVYVAPPDHHLVLEGATLRVIRGPKENRHRPAIDTLFRSAAYTHGSRVIGGLLSGTLSDGSAGLWAVGTCGGTTVVQDPETAQFPEMINRALATMKVHHVIPLKELGRALDRLTRAPLATTAFVPEERRQGVGWELQAANPHAGHFETLRKIAEPSAFACPDCGGGLWKVAADGVTRFRCHVGHGYTLDSLFEGQLEGVERALERALQMLEENARSGQMLLDMHEAQGMESPQRLARRVKDMVTDAESLRNLLERFRSD